MWSGSSAARRSCSCRRSRSHRRRSIASGLYSDSRSPVLHSGLSDGERYDAWLALRSGERRIAVGARSAVFAPLPDLGAIVVDEEHEASYKQGESPRYHAREVAIVRAREAGAVCVLGSATPSLESWENARAGTYRLLSLPARVGGGALPRVEVVDLRVNTRAAHLRRAGAPDCAACSASPSNARAERATLAWRAEHPPAQPARVCFVRAVQCVRVGRDLSGLLDFAHTAPRARASRLSLLPAAGGGRRALPTVRRGHTPAARPGHAAGGKTAGRAAPGGAHRPHGRRHDERKVGACRHSRPRRTWRGGHPARHPDDCQRAGLSDM